MKRVLTWLGVALLLLVLVLAINTWRAQPTRITVEPYAPALDDAALARPLSAAIAIPTLSPTPEAPSLDAFLALHAVLEREFPRVHATLTREAVAGASLLYHWRGRSDCAPLLLLAHQDVVPVEAGTLAQWRHPPFSGAIAEGYVFGRGAIDDKASLVGMLQAIELLLGADVVPACSIYLAFGHDEETGGDAGARALAALLQQRGVVPAYVLDEGGALTVDTFPGLTLPLATIGVAEKGYLSVQLRVRETGGHSSMPPRQTAIGILAAAIAKLEAGRPAAFMSPVQRELLQRVAPHLPLDRRMVLSNLWLTAPLVERLFAASPAADATLRTTTAPTIFHAGVKDNVLPQQAEAVVNFRLRPGDTRESVLAHVRATVDDARVEIAADEASAREPTEPAPWDDAGFAAIERALRRVSPEPELVVAPYVSNGGTDARHYAVLTPKLYRFVPYKLTPEELGAMHGSDERLALAEYVRTVRFYLALLQAHGTGPDATLSTLREPSP